MDHGAALRKSRPNACPRTWPIPVGLVGILPADGSPGPSVAFSVFHEQLVRRIYYLRVKVQAPRLRGHRHRRPPVDNSGRHGTSTLPIGQASRAQYRVEPPLSPGTSVSISCRWRRCLDRVPRPRTQCLSAPPGPGLTWVCGPTGLTELMMTLSSATFPKRFFLREVTGQSRNVSEGFRRLPGQGRVAVAYVSQEAA